MRFQMSIPTRGVTSDECVVFWRRFRSSFYSRGCASLFAPLFLLINTRESKKKWTKLTSKKGGLYERKPRGGKSSHVFILSRSAGVTRIAFRVPAHNKEREREREKRRGVKSFFCRRKWRRGSNNDDENNKNDSSRSTKTTLFFRTFFCSFLRCSHLSRMRSSRRRKLPWKRSKSWLFQK